MDTFERAVNETVLSGVAPLQLSYVGVFDGYGECPVAYRARTTLFTTATGAIENGRDLAQADAALGILLTQRALAHAIRCMQTLLDHERTTRWIAVEAAASLLTADDAYALLSDVLQQENCHCAERICLEFPPYVVGLDRAKVRRNIADIKSLGLLVALAPITQDFALTTLLDVPMDYVVLDASVTALATDRNKAGVLAAMIGLLHTMGASVVADGVKSDEEIRELTAVECFGFVPDRIYRGEFMLPMGARTQAEIEADEEGV